MKIKIDVRATIAALVVIIVVMILHTAIYYLEQM